MTTKVLNLDHRARRRDRGTKMRQGGSSLLADSGVPRSMNELLASLRKPLVVLFDERIRAPRGRRRALLLRRLLLGLELLCKLEEQLLLPALHDSAPAAAADVAWARQEIELLRDVALLAGWTVAGNRELALAVLQSAFGLHCARLDGMLAPKSKAAVDWTRLEEDMRGWLDRWRAEVQSAGEVEDEDRDPVGLPPR